MPVHPGRKPASDVPAARYRRQVVELLEVAMAREPGQHAQSKGRAAYAASGQAQGAADPIGPLQILDVLEQRVEPDRLDARNGVRWECSFEQQPIQLHLL